MNPDLHVPSAVPPAELEIVFQSLDETARGLLSSTGSIWLCPRCSYCILSSHSVLLKPKRSHCHGIGTQ